MAADDPICLCGDPKSQHRLGRRGCKALDCGCGEFEAADDAAEKERVNRALIPVLEDNAERLRAELGEQSTSARLREVERERNELSDTLDKVSAELTRALKERDANMTASARAARKLIEERDGAAEQWFKARERIEQLEVLLKAADQRFSDMRATTATAPVEIYGYDAWLCEVCGSRYRPVHDHPCGPLKPIRVYITERQEHHPR